MIKRNLKLSCLSSLSSVYLVELGNLVDCKYNNSIVVWLLESLMRAYATLLERHNNLI